MKTEQSPRNREDDDTKDVSSSSSSSLSSTHKTVFASKSFDNNDAPVNCNKITDSDIDIVTTPSSFIIFWKNLWSSSLTTLVDCLVEVGRGCCCCCCCRCTSTRSDNCSISSDTTLFRDGLPRSDFYSPNRRDRFYDMMSKLDGIFRTLVCCVVDASMSSLLHDMDGVQNEQEFRDWIDQIDSKLELGEKIPHKRIEWPTHIAFRHKARMILMKSRHQKWAYVVKTFQMYLRKLSFDAFIDRSRGAETIKEELRKTWKRRQEKVDFYNRDQRSKFDNTKFPNLDEAGPGQVFPSQDVNPTSDISGNSD